MALQEEFEKQGNFLFRHRGTLPIIIFAAGVVAYADHITDLVNPRDTFSDLYNCSCLLVTLFGLFIRIYTVGYSSKNTSGRNTQSQVADSVNTTGIYSVVRHPLYLGNFFMWLGMALLSRNPWFILAFICLYWLYYERIMFAEEQYLRKKFGDTYLQWAKITPAIIPGFRHYIPNVNHFNFYKVISQEKTGVMLVFALYFLFEQIYHYNVHDRVTIQYTFWLFSMLASVVAYIIIKIMEKYTGLLR